MTLTTVLMTFAISVIGASFHTLVWERWTASTRKKTTTMLANYRKLLDEARLILGEMQIMCEEKRLGIPGWQRDSSIITVEHFQESLENCESVIKTAEAFLAIPHHEKVMEAKRHLRKFTIHLQSQMLRMQKIINESKRVDLDLKFEQ
jgi:hypothetical protein